MQYWLIRTVNTQITYRSCCCPPLYPSPYCCQLMASFLTHCRVRRNDFWINKKYMKNWSWLITNDSNSSRFSRFIFCSFLRWDTVWCGRWLSTFRINLPPLFSEQTSGIKYSVNVLLRGVCHNCVIIGHVLATQPANIITNNLTLAYQTTRCHHRIHNVITQKLSITHRNKPCQPRSWHSPTRLHSVTNLSKIIPL
jgi:hypothetical protein